MKTISLAQIVRIDELPEPDASETQQQLAGLPFRAGAGAARWCSTGSPFIRELHSSSRSHVWLATDGDESKPLVIKTLSIEQQGDAAHVERFLMEEWIARRIHSAHVAKAFEPARTRNYLYTVTEYIDGQTLTQWMIDNPRPSLEAVRGIVEQIARGLQAFHRLEMLHQDLRPGERDDRSRGDGEDRGLRVGACGGHRPSWRAGDAVCHSARVQYTAPEYFLGEPGTPRSDLFSLGVHHLPDAVRPPALRHRRSEARTRAAQEKLALPFGAATPSARSPRGSTKYCGRPFTPIRTSATKSYPSSCTSCGIRPPLF